MALTYYENITRQLNKAMKPREVAEKIAELYNLDQIKEIQEELYAWILYYENKDLFRFCPEKR